MIRDNSITSDDLAPASVGAAELGSVFTQTSTSAPIVDGDGTNNGGLIGHGAVTATCPDGTRLLSGGARWVNASGDTLDANVYLQDSFRIGDDGWHVEGVVDYGAQGNIRIQAEAYCLGVQS